MEHAYAVWIGLFLLSMFAATFSSVVGGAALLLIPALNIAGLPLIAAIATVRPAAIAWQVVGIVAFRQEGDIQWRPALWAALWCMPGGFLGAELAIHVEGRLLSIIVALILLVLTAALIPFDKKHLKKARPVRFFYAWLGLVCGILGVYGGFYGACFSTFIMVAFVFLGGMDLMVASGSASVVSLGMSLAAGYPFIRSGLVDWQLMLPVMLGGCIGAWYGVELAVHRGIGWVKRLLILVMVATALKLIFFT
jgi:uncharacterized protein